MTRRTHLVLGSLLVIVSGGAFLGAPAPARAAETFDCEASVRAYCEYVATFCRYGATCTYNTTTCQITNAECNAPPVRPSTPG
jgi:hypothetical protein